MGREVRIEDWMWVLEGMRPSAKPRSNGKMIVK